MFSFLCFDYLFHIHKEAQVNIGNWLLLSFMRKWCIVLNIHSPPAGGKRMNQIKQVEYLLNYLNLL